MNKRIAISINTSWNIFHFRAGLMRALDAKHYAIISMAPRDDYTARLAAMVSQHVDVPMANAGTSPLQDVMLFVRYLRVLRATRPAVLLSYTIKPNVYGALAARVLGIPVIANVSGLGTAFIRRNWLTAVVKQLYRLAFRSVAWVFFQNAEDRDLFVAMGLVVPEKTVVLPGSGVDLAYFSPVERHESSGDAIAFVLVARLLWDKGIGEYVAAARMIKAEYPGAVFRLVGPTDVANKTAIAAHEIAAWEREGVIEYLGASDDVRAIIAQQDCVVLPSYREGLSRVLLEGAAMGKPLIATDVPGCRQVVDHGVNGLLCQPRDAGDLAAAMRQLIALTPVERRAMGAASRAKAEREFDEQQVFAIYLDKIGALTMQD